MTDEMQQPLPVSGGGSSFEGDINPFCWWKLFRRLPGIFNLSVCCHLPILPARVRLSAKNENVREKG